MLKARDVAAREMGMGNAEWVFMFFHFFPSTSSRKKQATLIKNQSVGNTDQLALMLGAFEFRKPGTFCMEPTFRNPELHLVEK